MSWHNGLRFNGVWLYLDVNSVNLWQIKAVWWKCLIIFCRHFPCPTFLKWPKEGHISHIFIVGILICDKCTKDFETVLKISLQYGRLPPKYPYVQCCLQYPILLNSVALYFTCYVYIIYIYIYMAHVYLYAYVIPRCSPSQIFNSFLFPAKFPRVIVIYCVFTECASIPSCIKVMSCSQIILFLPMS